MSLVSNEFGFIGNLTKDPILRYTPSGTPTTTYILAVDTEYTDGKGKLVEETDFIPITTYGKQAENDTKYLKKGSALAVKGRVKSWYNGTEKKGGFNFEPSPGCVKYLDKPRANRGQAAGGEEGGDGDWAREYAQHDQAGAAAAGKPRGAQ